MENSERIKILEKKTNKKIFKKIIPYLYVLPAVVLVTVFFIASAVFTISLSFTEWNGLSQINFVGFDN